MLATSLDGQWAIVRRGRGVEVFEHAKAPSVGRIELDEDDVDLAFVGPPTVLAAVTRGATRSNVRLFIPPYVEPVAQLDLERPMKLAAITGPRLILVSADGKTVQILRVAQRALASSTIDVGSAVEFTVGLERNQVLFGLLRKLEVWDAISARPLLRLQLQLPPPPRTIGAAHGHLWVTRPGSDEVFIYRLSDGRPFRHHVGSPVEEVIAHPGSPLIVMITKRGLVRLHCFAHSLSMVDAPWTPGMPLAQLVTGEQVGLIGMGDTDEEPWLVPIGGTSTITMTSETADPPAVIAAKAEKLRTQRAQATAEAVALAGGVEPPSAPTRPAPTAAATPPVATQVPITAPPSMLPPVPPPGPASRTLHPPPIWRDPLRAFGLGLARGIDSEVPLVDPDSELSELAHRLALPPPARRALIALYASYLVGEPALPIARLAGVVGDWIESLGQGDLHALAMLRRKDGKVALRATVTDHLDGVPPRAIRIVGEGSPRPRPGIVRLVRDRTSDAELEKTLAAELGQIAVIEGAAARGVLEARLLGTTAVALQAPAEHPRPWPRDAGLVIIADDGAPAWVAALPATAS